MINDDREEASESSICVDFADAEDRRYLTISNDNIGGRGKNHQIINGGKNISATNNNHNHCINDEIAIIHDQQSSSNIRTYKMRYVLLLMFITLSMSNAFQWIEYAIIESNITEYYRVTNFWVNCTSVVYMVSYIVGIVPATWLLDRYGLRRCLILAAFGNAAGSWIKCISVRRDGFWIGMIGQTVVAAAQLFILNIPPLLAATWFPANEVTRATAYGVFGNQVGIALGFLIPPALMPPLPVHNSTTTATSINSSSSLASFENDTAIPANIDIAGTATGLRTLFYSVSIATSAIFIAIVAFAESRPKRPPSEAAAYAQTVGGDRSFRDSIRSLFTNGNYCLILVSYGLNTGAFYAISTVLSQMISEAIGAGFTQEAGVMGLIVTVAGIVGSIVCGCVLGWTKRFKAVTLFVYAFSLIGTIAFTVVLEFAVIWPLFAVSALLGFFMTGYLPIGFEFAAEVSFPEPEGTSAGLLNASAQIFGIVFTFGSSEVIDRYGHLYANVVFIVALSIGVVLTALVKNDLRRQKAQLSGRVRAEPPRPDQVLTSASAAASSDDRQTPSSIASNDSN